LNGFGAFGVYDYQLVLDTELIRIRKMVGYCCLVVKNLSEIIVEFYDLS